MIEYIFASILLALATLVAFIILGIKKFIERTGEIIAEKLLKEK